MMSIRALKRLAFTLPLLFIGMVFLGMRWFDASIPWNILMAAFVVLGAGTLAFTIWAFSLIERESAEARHRSDQLAALHKAALALTKEIDLATVLQRVVDEARTLANARYGALGVLDGEKKQIDQFIVSGISPAQRSLMGPPPRGHGLLGVLIKNRESIRVPSISGDPRSVGFPPNHPPMRSLLGVPISFKDEVLGDLYLTDKTGISGAVISFTEQDRQLLEMFATQAAIAIKNAQFHRQSQQFTVLQERDRFGMDLHDGVIQSIYGIGLMLEEAQYQLQSQPESGKELIARSIEGLNHTIRDIRNYILDLRPQRFQGRDLQEGLAELARELRAHSFLNIDIDVESEGVSRLPPEQTVELLHIAREALTNIRKHARASHVELKVRNEPDMLTLLILDNGRGLDPDLILKSTGNGLHNMQERAQALGGNILFTRADSGGTHIQLHIPLVQ